MQEGLQPSIAGVGELEGTGWFWLGCCWTVHINKLQQEDTTVGMFQDVAAWFTDSITMPFHGHSNEEFNANWSAYKYRVASWY